MGEEKATRTSNSDVESLRDDKSKNQDEGKSVLGGRSENQTGKEENGNESYYKQMIIESNKKLESEDQNRKEESTGDDTKIRRHPLMIPLTGEKPFNAEPPLSRLMHHEFITPVPLHYVRNHGAVPYKDVDFSKWDIEVTGLVKKPTKFTMEQLVSDFPSREFPVTLVCAGNRRKEQNMVKQSMGFDWGSAAVSTTVWKGVPLYRILERCEIGDDDDALNVCFEGAEDLPGDGKSKSKYGTSITKKMAMDPSRDVILAYRQNGEPLAPDHGFPVRVIVPGFIGGRMVKWLKRIIVSKEESDSYYHYHDNRVLPSSIVNSKMAVDKGLWKKPEYIINELNINSVITTPGHGDELLINAETTMEPYTLKGYAYSGGGRKVTRVEVTLDDGDTWNVCELDHKEKPDKYGKYWCWCFWSLKVKGLYLFRAKDIAVRAWDESSNTQPKKLTWNLLGMMNNCWFRVKNELHTPEGGDIKILFKHPTLPGDQSGGWMVKQKQINKKDSLERYSSSEVKEHNTAESPWIIIHNRVYNCEEFLHSHPGGLGPILENAGKDCTKKFEKSHSDRTKELLEEYRIGDLDIALVDPRREVPVILETKTEITKDVYKFVFKLTRADQPLGLPVGKHIMLLANINGQPCERPYTPISNVDVVGKFELVVKIYFKNVNPKFPNGGLMSQHLHSLEPGAASVLHIKGPFGHIEYVGEGKFRVHGKSKVAEKLVMLAGGTGITPIYQVMQSILSDPEDKTEMFVLYANHTKKDILLREELDAWVTTFKERLKIWYVVSKNEEDTKNGENTKNDDSKFITGRITKAVLERTVSEDLKGKSLVLACGPPAMTKSLEEILEEMHYNMEKNLLIF